MIEMANEKSNFHFPLDAVRIDMIFAVEWLRIADDESFFAAVAMKTFACKCFVIMTQDSVQKVF